LLFLLSDPIYILLYICLFSLLLLINFKSVKRLWKVYVDRRGEGFNGVIVFGGGGGLEYRCLVCGRVFGSSQGLRGHVKVHRGQYVRFDVLVPRGTRDAFREVCRAHGLSTCHMIVSFMDAVVQSFRKGGVVEFDARTEELRAKGGRNPIHISIYQQFLGKPRSAWKLLLDERVHEVGLKCDVCGKSAGFLHVYASKLVGRMYMAFCGVCHRRDLRLHPDRVVVELGRCSVRKGRASTS